MFVSIVIPMRNEEKSIRRCLDSIIRRIEGRDNFEIFCVDGSSTDRMRQNVQTKAEKEFNICRPFAQAISVSEPTLN